MYEVLFDHLLTRFQILVLLLVGAGVVGAVFWFWQKRWQTSLATMACELESCEEKAAAWQNQTTILENELASSQNTTADLQSKVSSVENELVDCQDETVALRNRISTLESELVDCETEAAAVEDKAFALEEELADAQEKLRTKSAYTEYSGASEAYGHTDLLSGLVFISSKSAQTMNGLGKEQIALREKQNLIYDKAQELLQSAQNALDLAEPEDELETFLNVATLLEDIMNDLNPYAENKGVVFQKDLAAIEPVWLKLELTKRAIKNVLHNAIKYSLQGGVVEAVLSLQVGVIEGTEIAICIDIKDTGKGIKEDQHERIFEPRTRGKTIEPGHGLGLFLARDAARSLGGDVRLVRSSLNQGSEFRILLPYGGR